MAPIEQDGPLGFAWCFSHGRLHVMPSWCTAAWIQLVGTTQQEAMVNKHERFGKAQFLHELLLDRQMEVENQLR